MDGINSLTKAARTGKPSEKASESASSSSVAAGDASNAATMSRPCTTPNHEWLLDCDEASTEALELSSPAGPPEDVESDTFSEPFWQDVDGELTN